jgi:hypothetical protein
MNKAIANLEQYVREILRHVRGVKVAVVLLAFAAYGVAYFVWTQGQTLGAIVVATLGYMLLRSLRKITYNLAWQRFSQRAGYGDIMSALDADTLSRGKAAVLREVSAGSNPGFSEPGVSKSSSQD